MNKIRIAVQKSGRLNQDSLRILKEIGISIDVDMPKQNFGI